MKFYDVKKLGVWGEHAFAIVGEKESSYICIDDTGGLFFVNMNSVVVSASKVEKIKLSHDQNRSITSHFTFSEPVYGRRICVHERNFILLCLATALIHILLTVFILTYH